MKQIKLSMYSVFTSVLNTNSFLKKLPVLLFLIVSLLIGGKSWGQTALVTFTPNSTTCPGGTGNYGTSPLAATSNNANVTIVGLTRGAGIGSSSNSGAATAWGGYGNSYSTEAAAISASSFATFL